MAAKTVAQIRTQLTAFFVTAFAGIGITIDPTQWSRRNKNRATINAFAEAQAIFEQTLDSYNTDTETAIAAASPQTGPWWEAQMRKFQFDATTPQIVQFDETNFAPYYTDVDEDLQVIKYVSVVGTTLGRTLIKVAAQSAGFPVDLDTAYPGALDAAKSYANLMPVDGIKYEVQSGNSDKIYIEATIYYRGLYSAIISDNVIAAIEAYLAGIPFNGTVTLSDLEVAIKEVAGVTDYVPVNIQARADGVAYGSGTNLVVSSSTTARKYATVAGYIVGETTATHTLLDSLTFIAE